MTTASSSISKIDELETLDRCAINGWDEDDYSFEEHLEEIKN